MSALIGLVELIEGGFPFVELVKIHWTFQLNGRFQLMGGIQSVQFVRDFELIDRGGGAFN